MGIPLLYFLIAWVILVGIFLILSLISLLVFLRFGLVGSMTFLSTLIFISISALALLASASYLAGVDWSQRVQIASYFEPLTIQN